MKVDYVSHMGDDLSVVNAARVSFDARSNFIGAADAQIAGMMVEAKQTKNDVDVLYVEYTKRIPDFLVNEGNFLSRGDYGLIHYLAKHKHTSCFEHQVATLRLKVPIFIARQIQRHRTFSYNEVSRRYVDTPPEFFWPDVWRARADNVKQGSSEDVITDLSAVGMVTPEYEELYGKRHIVDPQKYAEHWVNQMLHVYSEMLDSSVAPELARMILPQNMYTEFYMTGNLRNWAHFLHLRLDGHAQKEVQDVAQMVSDILAPLYPVSMEALLKYHE